MTLTHSHGVMYSTGQIPPHTGEDITRACSCPGCPELVTVETAHEPNILHRTYTLQHGTNPETRRTFTGHEMLSPGHLFQMFESDQHRWLNPGCPVCSWQVDVHNYQAAGG